MNNEIIIRTATFNPKVCTYWLLSGTIILLITVIGIPLLLIWLPVGYYFTKRYLSRLECVLTDKDLKVNKGLFVRVEKTIPLEKITDLGMVQGPIMISPEVFRESVLQQRDQLRSGQSTAPTKELPSQTTGEPAILKEIHETLLRIENQLKTK